MTASPPPDAPRTVPPLGRAIMVAVAALVLMVVLGVFGLYRHYRQKREITERSGGVVFTTTNVPPASR